MSAIIEKTTVPRRFLAWCDRCSDGYRGGKVAATKWAERHNSTRHAP